ncbi:hypothetical protein M0R45_009309 [Rubus argutus]|uniref:Uncharacterized protein n=1 Tax=Rubus argutus TaxID=59490 RepID=A0AAW1Y737_RUBAR
MPLQSRATVAAVHLFHAATSPSHPTITAHSSSPLPICLVHFTASTAPPLGVSLRRCTQTTAVESPQRPHRSAPVPTATPLTSPQLPPSSAGGDEGRDADAGWVVSWEASGVAGHDGDSREA